MTSKGKPDTWKEIKAAVAAKRPNAASNMEKSRATYEAKMAAKSKGKAY